MAAHFISSPIYGAVGYPGNHPLSIQRIGTVEKLCALLGWTGNHAPVLRSPVADDALLSRFHAPEYISALRDSEGARSVTEAARERHNIGTLENPVFPGLFNRAATSVGGSYLAGELAAKGALAYHPAGGTHHGLRDRANGFCFFNDPVFAILALLDAGLERVLYADLDAHHGDGVEVAFADDPRVMTISVHEEDRWPFTGLVSDRAGGNARNLPVPREMNDTEFDLLMAEAVLPAAQGFSPQAVVVTTGADALKGDPLSSLALSNTCLWDAVEALVALAPRAVVLGGGGYNPWTLARAWSGLWARLSGQSIPDELPAEARDLLKTLECDLVDDEDEQDPAWFTTIADRRNDGPIRERFRDIARAVRGTAPADG
ncbi:acetoin utilization protein AcuC [Ostreiculturibacter nitratireducens]|uniref:acetoin utilization protein AcuC n=1 Tax=Ostreiculturibacter nitratireducens TaxID=3075226 RepID=UPI0031B6137F